MVERLRARGVADVIVPRRRDYDLTHEADVVRLYQTTRPDVVLHLAAEATFTTGIEYLCTGGAEVGYGTNKGRAPLH